MASVKRKAHFLDSEEAAEIKRVLRLMALDAAYHTESSYSANSELYPDNQIPFEDKHMNYLNTHPSADPGRYISNLRLMTRIR